MATCSKRWIQHHQHLSGWWGSSTNQEVEERSNINIAIQWHRIEHDEKRFADTSGRHSVCRFTILGMKSDKHHHSSMNFLRLLTFTAIWSPAQWNNPSQPRWLRQNLRCHTTKFTAAKLNCIPTTTRANGQTLRKLLSYVASPLKIQNCDPKW